MSNKSTRTRYIVLVALIAAAFAAVIAIVFVARRNAGPPLPGSAAYEQVTREFYHGLAALEVGLLDDARRAFTSATNLVPEEPASWANLGLANLRLGELDTAAGPIERALSLAPDNPDLVLLAGRMEIARGRLDEGVAHLRRATELQPDALRARFALADEVERAAGPDADAQALALLDELARLAPDNAAIQVERARLSAKRRDASKLGESIARLEPLTPAWPPLAVEQFRALQQAAAAADFPRAQLATTFLRNVLTSVPSFLENLIAVRTPTELIAEPLDRFVRLMPPIATPAPPDLSLTFDAEPVGDTSAMVLSVIVAVAPDDEQPPRLFGADASELVSLAGPAVRAPFPAGNASVPSGNGLLALDWNNDFRTDIVMAGGGGIRLLVQGADGAFSDETPADAVAASCDCFGAWAADVEMDGDLDIIAAPLSGEPLVLRNNGNGTWTSVQMFPGISGARGFAWADMDRDGDPDAVFLDSTFTLHAYRNRQAGDFVRLEGFPDLNTAVAMTVADVDADGLFDVVTLDETGAIRRISRRGDTWDIQEIATWERRNALPGSHRLIAADLDNNGAVDLIATGGVESRIWLGDERHRLQPLQAAPAGLVFAAADLNSDGRLDIVATIPAGDAAPRDDAGALPFRPGQRAVQLLNRGKANYHWKVVRPRAQPNAGDQRINSFGVGGEIEVRSGLLVQKQLLTGGPVHIGLGERTSIDVARIVWPNGVAQAEFGVDVDDVLVAEQRLKGSCPWVFAWDGTRMSFVTDFLWRSPLGLRINAQDTAGVSQTEDWVRISGDQLAPQNGAYDVRITAELWETHFFDHVSLMVVDHPANTDVFVDERFLPGAPPALAVHAVEDIRPVARAWDHRGADVTEFVARRDGRHLATFEKGAYQGIAEEHFVEFELGDDVAKGGLAPRSPGERGLTLLASGWIYPTDSSINMAIGQGGHVSPMGLSLEARDAGGHWRTVNPDLGFPAGKNKTIVIDLSGIADARRLRLRTNLEIYWDSLEYAVAVEAPLRAVTLQPNRAELRYRGFSETTSPRADVPETPQYDRIATTSQRWRDLIGYHTRFGDVRELLHDVDDRYVIMNAGDELHMLFAEQPAPPAGWRRDFVLIGDGWEKDGDYNTGFSQTVLPLPSHDRPDYGAGVKSLALEDDPVYLRHRDDWRRYHTRYVTPRAFVNGLRRSE